MLSAEAVSKVEKIQEKVVRDVSGQFFWPLSHTVIICPDGYNRVGFSKVLKGAGSAGLKGHLPHWGFDV